MLPEEDRQHSNHMQPSLIKRSHGGTDGDAPQLIDERAMLCKASDSGKRAPKHAALGIRYGRHVCDSAKRVRDERPRHKAVLQISDFHHSTARVHRIKGTTSLKKSLAQRRAPCTTRSVSCCRDHYKRTNKRQRFSSTMSNQSRPIREQSGARRYEKQPGDKIDMQGRE
jgi:hypothetical protein